MMRALDPEVHDAVFEAIEGLLPDPPSHPLGCHRPRISNRVCFRGLLIRIVTGSAWETVEFLMGHEVSGRSAVRAPGAVLWVGDAVDEE